MKSDFDKWLRATLAPSGELEPEERVKIDNALRGAMLAKAARRDRGRIQRFVLRGAVGFAVVAVVLLVDPRALGSKSRDLKYVGDLGPYGNVWEDPIHGQRGATADLSQAEIEESEDKQVANEIIGIQVVLTRYHGRDLWTAYDVIALDNGTLTTKSSHSAAAKALPPRTIPRDDLVAIMPYMVHFVDDFLAGKGVALPSERLVLAGQAFEIRLRRLTYPEIGEVTYGLGTAVPE